MTTKEALKRMRSRYAAETLREMRELATEPQEQWEQPITADDLHRWADSIAAAMRDQSAEIERLNSELSELRSRVMEPKGVSELTLEEYNQRAEPRLKEIDRLAKRIDFGSFSWKLTWEGEEYERLMREQGEDEQRAGL